MSMEKFEGSARRARTVGAVAAATLVPLPWIGRRDSKGSTSGRFRGPGRQKAMRHPCVPLLDERSVELECAA